MPSSSRHPALHAARPQIPAAGLGLLGDPARVHAVACAARALGVVARAVGPTPAPGARAGAAFEVVTALAEHVPAEALARAATGDGVWTASARPSPSLLAIAQDRNREKGWLDARAGHAAPWRLADDAAALAAAVTELTAEGPGGVGFAAGCVVKPCRRRPDGARPLAIHHPDEAPAVWAALGGHPCVVERALAIETELVVLVARTPRGALATWPVAQTLRDGTTPVAHLLPAAVHPSVARKAERTAAFYAGKLAVEGLLAVELFVLGDGRMVVNELVPCPHPAFDGAELACETGQHEQLVRAVCDLPLGATTLVRASATVPLDAALLARLAPSDHPSGSGLWLRLPEHDDAPDARGGQLTAFDATSEGALARARTEAARLAGLAELARAPHRGGATR